MRLHIALMTALVVLTAGPGGGLVAQDASSSANDTFSPNLFGGLEYRMVGPSRGGRVTAVAGHREQPSTFLYGRNRRRRLEDNRLRPELAQHLRRLPRHRLDWRDPRRRVRPQHRLRRRPARTVCAATSSSVRVCTSRPDAGETWEHVGLEKTGNSGAVLIHPQNPDLAYVAAIGNPFASNPERGVYRTMDGGTSWEQVLFVSGQTGAVDLEFAPDNPDEIYASMWLAERKPWTIVSGGYEGGVYKSSDGGDTWTHLTEGLPNGLRGKSDLAVSGRRPGSRLRLDRGV